MIRTFLVALAMSAMPAAASAQITWPTPVANVIVGGQVALVCDTAGKNCQYASVKNPMAVAQAWGPATSTPLTFTVSTTATTTSAAFTPQLARPIVLTITGTWAGTVQVLRSVDGGATLNPLTYIDGSAKGSYTANMQAPITVETEAAATYYVRMTLSSGAATARLAN